VSLPLLTVDVAVTRRYLVLRLRHYSRRYKITMLHASRTLQTTPAPCPVACMCTPAALTCFLRAGGHIVCWIWGQGVACVTLRPRPRRSLLPRLDPWQTPRDAGRVTVTRADSIEDGTRHADKQRVDRELRGTNAQQQQLRHTCTQVT